MIKTIFVPASGTQADQYTFAAALAVAKPLGAHLDFYHQRTSACEAAIQLPHVQFCVGTAITHALARLDQRDEDLSDLAAKHFGNFAKPIKYPYGKTAGPWAMFPQVGLKRPTRRRRGSCFMLATAISWSWAAGTAAT